MKGEHLHSGIEDVIFVTIAAIVGFNVVRLSAAWLVQRGGTAEKVGSVMGGLVRFGGS